MGCDAIMTPFYSCEEEKQRRSDFLEYAEPILQKFGYPPRAKFLVESIEQQLSEDSFRITTTIYFAGRKRNKNYINTHREYTKTLKRRSFYSQELF